MEKQTILSKAAGILRQVLRKPETTLEDNPKPVEPAAPAIPAEPTAPTESTK